MAVSNGPYSGNDGAVYVGGNVVAKITDFEFSESMQTRQQTALGDTWEQNKGGLKSVSGRVACWYDPGDSTGQEALSLGAEVTLELRNEAAGDSTDPETTIEAIITERRIVNGDNNATVSLEISFVGNDSATNVTHGTV